MSINLPLPRPLAAPFGARNEVITKSAACSHHKKRRLCAFLWLLIWYTHLHKQLIYLIQEWTNHKPELPATCQLDTAQHGLVYDLLSTRIASRTQAWTAHLFKPNKVWLVIGGTEKVKLINIQEFRGAKFDLFDISLRTQPKYLRFRKVESS